MSKWHDSTFQIAYANASNWQGSGTGTKQYMCVMPDRYRPGPHSSIDYDRSNDNGGAHSPPKFPESSGTDLMPSLHMRSDISIPEELVPRPMIHQQHIPHVRSVYVNSPSMTGVPPAVGQYVPMQMTVNSMPSHENISHGHNFHIHSDHWDTPVVGVIHDSLGGIETPIKQPLPRVTHEKRISRATASNSPMLDSVSSSDGVPTSQGSMGNRNLKRSRMGCLTCRSRKKRCCEIRPTCGECDRLRLKCVWPKPGTEHKNKPKEIKKQENMIEHETYGKIKVLRGIVEYRSD